MEHQHYFTLRETLQGLQTDPVTANDPIKRMFLCDGEQMSANVSIIDTTDDALHIQPDHDEIVMVIDGECDFRVGEQIRPVKAGDMIFIPRHTVHGPILTRGRVGLLSIFAPYFDRAKKNILWSKNGFA